MATEQRATLKPVQEWFTFEGRCMVCGTKIGRPNQDDNGLCGAHYLHLDVHCRDGHMEKTGAKLYEQVKAHPVGFPGILLPKEMEWTR
jgi:hypothetical protein